MVDYYLLRDRLRLGLSVGQLLLEALNLSLAIGQHLLIGLEALLGPLLVVELRVLTSMSNA